MMGRDDDGEIYFETIIRTARAPFMAIESLLWHLFLLQQLPSPPHGNVGMEIMNVPFLYILSYYTYYTTRYFCCDAWLGKELLSEHFAPCHWNEQKLFFKVALEPVVVGHSRKELLSEEIRNLHISWCSAIVTTLWFNLMSAESLQAFDETRRGNRGCTSRGSSQAPKRRKAPGSPTKPPGARGAQGGITVLSTTHRSQITEGSK